MADSHAIVAGRYAPAFYGVSAAQAHVRPTKMTSADYIGDISDWTDYQLFIQFTKAWEPALLAEGTPLVSLVDEIDANSRSLRGAEIREQFGRIPYGSPLYWWETERDGQRQCAYIGQTVHQTLQKRFEGHGALVRLLAQHVNDNSTRVLLRLCLRFDLISAGRRVAIEHLPPEQAARIVDDVEGFLIYKYQPQFNRQLKASERAPSIPFTVHTLEFDAL